MLFHYRFSAPIPALMRHLWIVVRAIQADFQIRATLMARFRTAWLSGQGEFPAAFVAMSSEHFLKFTWKAKALKRFYPHAKFVNSTCPSLRACPDLTFFSALRG